MGYCVIDVPEDHGFDDLSVLTGGLADLHVVGRERLALRLSEDFPNQQDRAEYIGELERVYQRCNVEELDEERYKQCFRNIQLLPNYSMYGAFDRSVIKKLENQTGESVLVADRAAKFFTWGLYDSEFNSEFYIFDVQED